MALWKARSLTPEQKVQLIEEESEARNLITEESGSFLGLEDVSLSEVYSSVLPVPVRYPFPYQLFKLALENGLSNSILLP